MKLMIVDPNVLFRQGLQNLLSREAGFDIVGVAATCHEAVEVALSLQPDVMLLRGNLPDGSGLNCLRQIVAHRPECKVVILATQDANENLFETLRSGAQGYFLTDKPVSHLVAALKGLEQGHLALSRAQAKLVIDEFSRLGTQSGPQSGMFDQLGRREIEVLRHIGMGATNREIAAQLVISEHTVKIHVQNIQRKLALQNRDQISSFARRYGL